MLTPGKTVKVLDENGMLPLFTAHGYRCGINAVKFSRRARSIRYPRTQTRSFTADDCRKMNDWVALSLDQFEKLFLLIIQQRIQVLSVSVLI